MLDAVVSFLPSPLDVPPTKGKDLKGEKDLERLADDKEPLSALAFKIMADQHLGKLVFARIYSGMLAQGDTVLNSTRDRKERIGRIVQMHANHREPRDVAYAGDIIALVGLKHTTTGDTLCDQHDPIVLERLDFPEPVIHVAVEPKTKADQDKLSRALQTLSEEDPTFQRPWRRRHRPDDHRRHGRAAPRGPRRPDAARVPCGRQCRQTAGRLPRDDPYRVEKVEHRYVRQTGGRGQYGHVVLNLEPTGPGGGYEFVDKITGGVIPKEYIPAVDAGIQDAMQSGVLAGFPTVDLRATLVYGSYHDVDSSEMAFKIAASMCFKEACKRAHPVLLEPIMAVEVVTPEDYLGDVIGDLASRGEAMSKEWTRGRTTRLFAQKCRWPRCSAMRLTCAAARRVGRPTPCSSGVTRRYLSRSPRK